jgi:glycosyltransferase involved in cell wall biosynthesis
MKVLSLGLDRNILDKNSAVAQRAFLYERKLDKYLVLVPDDGNKILALFKLYFLLKQTLKKDKFDLVTIQDIYFLPLVVWPLRARYKFKVEIQVHGFEKFNIFRRLLFKYNIKKADLVRVVSLRLKKELVNNFKLADNKIYIAPVAVDKNKFLEKNSNINLHQEYPGKFIFLTVSRLVPVKNMALQFEAIARLSEDIKNKIILLVIGDGPEKNNLQDLVKNLQIEEQVKFLGSGFSLDLVSYYQRADCFLLTSNSEGYGMVIAEAILSNLPVIMTDVGVAGELVEDNINGFVVPVNSLEILQQKMELLIENKELLVKFKNNTSIFKEKILDREELINRVITNWQGLL